MADVKVALPPGCDGLQVGGRTYRRAAGGEHAMVPERAAEVIRSVDTGGIVSASAQTLSVGTRKGRWCMQCSPPRLWNAWSHSCPRCGAPTEPE